MKSTVKFIVFFIVSAILVAADQITKIAAAHFLKGKDPFVIIPGVLEFRYLENRGMAWGMMQGAGIFFIILTCAILTAVIFFMVRLPYKKRFYPLIAFAAQLFAGGVGNLIDRVGLKYVRDFIYVKAINFPIFNVADVCVTCAISLLVILIIFVYREKDYEQLKSGKEKS